MIILADINLSNYWRQKYSKVLNFNWTGTVENGISSMAEEQIRVCSPSQLADSITFRF
jgi:hypothetical protein